MLCCVIAADYGIELLGRLKGMRARPVIAGIACVMCFATGLLAVARECVGDYELFSAGDARAAAYVEENTDQDALFITGDQHNNFVSSLAGRRVVCGPDLWLYWHGYDQETGVRHGEIRLFYEDPENNLDILEKYGVDYILVSEHERYNYDVMEDELARLFPVLYDRDGIAVYDARGRKG